MLEINQDFFKAEYREGFFVNERMKHAWAAELKLLDMFDEFCKEYGLRYFVTYGTLIGAIRHKGFIPWDDDIDIFMPRADYDILINNLYTALPWPLNIYSHNTDSNFDSYFTSLRNREDIGEIDEITQMFFDCPFIVGSDIYPVDFVCADKEAEEGRRLLFNAVYDTAMKFDLYEKEGNLFGLISQIEELCGCTIDKSKPIRKQLWVLANKIASLFSEKESDGLAIMTSGVTRSVYQYDLDAFSDAIMMPFEMIKVPAPKGYDQILKISYGDYMVPIQAHTEHDYPFFKKQIPYLKKAEKYTVTEEKDAT